jgi:hypothetical protein
LRNKEVCDVYIKPDALTGITERMSRCIIYSVDYVWNMQHERMQKIFIKIEMIRDFLHK